jgi:hypothetical protein
MMSRRDFVTIAEVLRKHIDEYDGAGDGGAVLVVDEISRDLADRFSRSTPAFERERFLTACGITPQQ